ncbi:MACPF domain-containing protein [Nymphaea thermarum]|nr:MACPF domain-containing protein [Nymphaea thermarum]
MARRGSPQGAAEMAIGAIGRGYDVAVDLRLKYCKFNSPDHRLIELDQDHVQDVTLPGGISVANVPTSIKCDKGERMRFRSDVLSFQQVCSSIAEKVSLTDLGRQIACSSLRAHLFRRVVESRSIIAVTNRVTACLFFCWIIVI